MWLYWFTTPSDEPPLAANIGGPGMWEDVGRNPDATYATRVTLSTAAIQLRQSSPLASVLHSEDEQRLPVSSARSCEDMSSDGAEATKQPCSRLLP